MTINKKKKKFSIKNHIIFTEAAVGADITSEIN